MPIWGIWSRTISWNNEVELTSQGVGPEKEDLFFQAI